MKRPRRTLRRLLVAGGVLGVVVVAGGWIGREYLLGSLPTNEGVRVVAGLGAAVGVEFDGAGIPTITAETAEDAAFALGFVHARDRYFQMDVYRRLAGGTLSELAGSAALPVDRERRAYGFTRVAGEVLGGLAEGHRAQIDAYVRGVNAGLADLGARPPEYALLGLEPAAWKAEDCLLVQFTMFDGLNFSAESELEIDALARAYPEEVVEFLTPDSTRRDTLLTGAGDHAPVPIPEALAPWVPPEGASREEGIVGEMFGEARGSNSWAVAGARTRDGRAILSNDPHLELGTPSVWYRARVRWTTSAGDRIDAVGVTLPGFPGVVIGSTERIAWGFTNSGADQEDMVLVERDPADASRYLVDGGSEPFTREEEVLRARGGAVETLVVERTRWGPVMRRIGDRAYVKRWVALDPEKVNFNLLDLPGAMTIERAAEIAGSWHGPSQNVLLADDKGRIAWTLSGFLPARRGFDGKRPVVWVGGTGWEGEAEKPAAVFDPPEGFLVTANNRLLSLEASRGVSRFWMLPDRAARIAEVLRASPVHDEGSLAALQLDTRAAALEVYRDLLLSIVPEDDPDPRFATARRLAREWNGHADADQSGYPILRAFRLQLRVVLLTPLVAGAHEHDAEFKFTWPLAEEPVLRILEERPARVLPAGTGTWEEACRLALAGALAGIEISGRKIDEPWGAHNRARLHHPVSRAIPAAGRWLDMPDDPLDGDMNVVRVARGRFGASMRMVVSPGHRADGIMTAPAGQSGHPFSKHYRSGHADWLAGRAAPLLPGPKAENGGGSIELRPK